MEIRLQKFLADAGIASRRKAEELIAAGKVEVNGRIVTELGTKIDPQKDEVIYQGRNELRQMLYEETEVVIKSFRLPNLINRIAYGWLRSSKAERSFRYAERLLKMGIHTPKPIGYYTERKHFLFARSYYACYRSSCPYTYADLLRQSFPDEEAILQAIAQTTARLHEAGWLHKDYSRGNILFGLTPEGVRVEIIDLNRFRFKQVGWEEGCRNFERLPLNDRMLTILTSAYAQARGFDVERCLEWMRQHHANRI